MYIIEREIKKITISITLKVYLIIYVSGSELVLVITLKKNEGSHFLENDLLVQLQDIPPRRFF